jgi:hypothetical protein
MIELRSVILGLCSLIAMPAVIRAASIISISSNGGLNINPVAEPAPDSVVFTIHGWNGGERSGAKSVGQRVVTFQLTSSWRTSWLSTLSLMFWPAWRQINQAPSRSWVNLQRPGHSAARPLYPGIPDIS